MLIFKYTLSIILSLFLKVFFCRKNTKTMKRARGLSEINVLEVRMVKRNAGREKVDLAWSPPQINGPSAILPELCLNIN